MSVLRYVNIYKKMCHITRKIRKECYIYFYLMYRVKFNDLNLGGLFRYLMTVLS